MNSKKTKPTPAMIAMLENMATGLHPMDGLTGRSARGGATRTFAALWWAGLRDENGVTAEGFGAIAASRSNDAVEK
jgi:hypothetical protein